MIVLLALLGAGGCAAFAVGPLLIGRLSASLYRRYRNVGYQTTKREKGPGR